MPGDKQEAKNATQKTEEGVHITEALITKRNLTFPEDEDLSEKMFHTLDDLETVRLDGEGITCIGNLERLRNIHSLYLQSNKIQRIENLACITSLRFLSLAGNQIRHVENLLDLQYLQFLDLSENLIETLKLGRNTLPGCTQCVLRGVLLPLGSKLLVIFAVVPMPVSLGGWYRAA